MGKLNTFIVHGHDTVAKLELKDYLQNTLGFPEPIILHQQPNKGRTVIEKFEDVSGDVDLALVLLTPDDIAQGGKYRARQNVVYELGYFVGTFGRKSGRVILLHKGNVEIPSDLAGVIYIDISNGITAAGEEIRSEIEGLEPIVHTSSTNFVPYMGAKFKRKPSGGYENSVYCPSCEEAGMATIDNDMPYVCGKCDSMTTFTGSELPSILGEVASEYPWAG